MANATSRPAASAADQRGPGALGHGAVGAQQRAVEIGGQQLDRRHGAVQQLAAAEPGTQRLGHVHRPVGLLVVVEQAGDRARDRAQRAVQGGDRRDRCRPLGPRVRMLSRRDWNVVQFEVEVSSR